MKKPVIVHNSNFTNNYGGAIYLAYDMKLSGIVLFTNNTAVYGGAMYISQKTTVTFDDKATVKFIVNTAKLYGGAIYVDLECIVISYNYHTINSDTFRIGSNNVIMFINNSASTGYNSIYFNIPVPGYTSCPNYRKILMILVVF